MAGGSLKRKAITGKTFSKFNCEVAVEESCGWDREDGARRPTPVSFGENAYWTPIAATAPVVRGPTLQTDFFESDAACFFAASVSRFASSSARRFTAQAIRPSLDPDPSFFCLSTSFLVIL